MERHLRAPGERSKDHLAVDRVGRCAAPIDDAVEPEADHAGDVVVELRGGDRLPGDHRVDVPPALEDEGLLRGLDVGGGDGDGAGGHVASGALVAERVDDARVPARQVVHARQGLGLEALARLRGVPGGELRDLGVGEGGEVDVLDGDVEGRRGGEPRGRYAAGRAQGAQVGGALSQVLTVTEPL